MTLGRPPALNAERQATILNAIRTGATEKRAAAFGGVSLEAVRQWRRKGEAALQIRAGLRNPTQRLYADFVLSFDRALAETAIQMQAVVTNVARLGLHREGEEAPTVEQQRISLQAATWWLSHRERDDYTTRAEITGKDGGAIELDAGEAWSAILQLAGREAEAVEDDDVEDAEIVEIK